MASSGVYEFNPNTFQIICGALRICGAIESGETPPADEYADALLALNALVKAWQVNGLHVWTQETIEVALVATQVQYVIGIGSGGTEVVRPLRMSEAKLVSNLTGEQTPLVPMSRLDFANVPNTATPGPPRNFFYDPQIPFGSLYVYPAPVDTSQVLRATVQRPLQDFVSQGDTADLPIEWSSALRFALAVEMAPEYGLTKDRFETIKTLADDKLKIVQEWDVEAQGTTTYPFPQPVFQIIARALRLCGGVSGQEIPKYGQVLNAFYALNQMVQAWQAMQIHVWAQQEAMLFLQPNQIEYQLGATSPDHATLSSDWVLTLLASNAAQGDTSITVQSIVGFDDGDQIGVWLTGGTTFWTTVSGTPTGSTITLAAALTGPAAALGQVVGYTTALNRPLRVPATRSYLFAPPGGQPIKTPMQVYSRLDYNALPNPTTPGVTTAFYFDPRSGQTPYLTAIMHVWPAPSNNSRAVEFTLQRPLNTFETLDSVQDFPAEWTQALVWNLAVEMWPEYVDKRAQMPKADWDISALAAGAAERLMLAQNWDREPQSIYIGLSNYPSARD
jgi:hypothetical protein